MNTRVPRDEIWLRRQAEATVWRVRLTETDSDSSEAFEEWLSHPDNAAAWARVQAPWALIGDAATSPEVMAARRDALHHARAIGRRRWTENRSIGVLAAAVFCLLFGGLIYVLSTTIVPSEQEYRTALGERRLVTLSDGSKVSLDSGTAVTIRYSREARRLELLSGQARFDVAHDVRRPFSVKARDQTVIATGTAFNVDLLGSRVLVTLIQGRVTVIGRPPERPVAAIKPGQITPPARVVLGAGQQLVASVAAPAKIESVSLDRVTAWETGQVVFYDEPLAAVAERLSRYSDHPITVEPSAGAMRLSGVFTAGDVSTFVDTVTRYLPVQAIDGSAGEITLRRKS